MKISGLVGAFLTVFFLLEPAAQERIIKKSVKLKKGALLSTPLVIKGDNITLNGNGAVIQGPGRPGKPETYTGTGILAEGCSNITILNLRVQGFERGLAASNGTGWRIGTSDFSDNYHDPDHGWGDYKRVGGIILTRISKSEIRMNRASRVWNGLDLRQCSRITIVKNDFSHCSNVCLKLWTSTSNHVQENNLSHGIRIRPGEVHARDSTGVLIESGSNGNTFVKNDITHGGDGVFIRVLNQWVSTGNTFIENDCSFANNNGFESWSPGNTYLRNKANHCSFGFWLGGSDHTVLIGNEASYNGLPDGNHNAPESDFVHGGIVIIHGSGSHTLIDDNRCYHNNGAGIVFRGDLHTRGEKWKMVHLVVQRNRLEHNRWGLFVRFTDGLTLSGNLFKDNGKDEFFENVTNLTRVDALPGVDAAPVAMLKGPSMAKVGMEVTFDASGSKDAAGRPLTFRWDVGGKRYTGPVVDHVFDRPGFHRVGVTVTNGSLSSLAFRDFYAVKPVRETATEGQAFRWGWTMGNNADGRGHVHLTNDAVAMVGRRSVLIRPDPYKGSDIAAFFPKDRAARWNLKARKHLTFWLRFLNPNNGFQGPNPIVRLHSGKASWTYTPAYRGIPRNVLGDLPYNEARYGWLFMTVPLAGGESWVRSETFEGRSPPCMDHDLEFITRSTPFRSRSSSSLVSDGSCLYCMAAEENRLFKSRDGRQWTERKNPAVDLKGARADWINGMLAFHPGHGKKGRLVLALRFPEKNRYGQNPRKLAAYDIAANVWSWLPTAIAMGHGATVVGDHLFGLAHAVAGNYGGPLCRVNLADPGAADDRSVIGSLKGENTGWLSRAAQLAQLGGNIYGIKNDWITPQPAEAARIGDRLFMFDPGKYAASKFAGGNRWNDRKWKEARTPAVDLGPLPFEVGHGAALVALPPAWCKEIGRSGGLFIVAGCSPSDHEGHGAPSNRYALVDIESRCVTVGTLPGPTGKGTSAVLHKGRLFIKRGGLNYGPPDAEIWEVNPLPPGKAGRARARLKRDRFNRSRVDSLSVQFDSSGHEPFSIWIDGLAFE